MKVPEAKSSSSQQECTAAEQPEVLAVMHDIYLCCERGAHERKADHPVVLP